MRRLRYAAEAIEPVWGKDTRALARAAKQMASDLGVRQDAVVTRPELLALARQAGAAGESEFTFGLVHAEERRIAEEGEGRFTELFSRVRRAQRRARL